MYKGGSYPQCSVGGSPLECECKAHILPQSVTRLVREDFLYSFLTLVIPCTDVPLLYHINSGSLELVSLIALSGIVYTQGRWGTDNPRKARNIAAPKPSATDCFPKDDCERFLKAFLGTESNGISNSCQPNDTVAIGPSSVRKGFLQTCLPSSGHYPAQH